MYARTLLRGYFQLKIAFLCGAIAAAVLVGGCKAGESTSAVGVRENMSGGATSAPMVPATSLFIAFDVSDSSRRFRGSFFESAAQVISEVNAKRLGVIGFGQKPYEFYYGPLLSRRDYITRAREWQNFESASSKGTDLSAPFIMMQSLLANQEGEAIAVYLFTDAGTELMNRDRQDAFVRVLTGLHENHSLKEVFVTGVRSGVNDNYRQQIRDLFAKTPVQVTIY